MSGVSSVEGEDWECECEDSSLINEVVHTDTSCQRGEDDVLSSAADVDSKLSQMREHARNTVVSDNKVFVSNINYSVGVLLAC